MKRIIIVLGLIAVIGITLYQFHPLLQGEIVTLFPFNIDLATNSLEVESSLGQKPMVLGAVSGYTEPYSSYAAGFSGVTRNDLNKLSSINSSLYLGGLGQGGVMSNADKGLAGYGTSYLDIYNPSPVGTSVKITFYQLGGEDIGKKEVAKDSISIPAKDGIMEPMWIKLKAACTATVGCTPSLVGPETAWAGYAKVQVRSTPTGFIGIFAASQSVSADGEYSFGHDAFIFGRDTNLANVRVLQGLGAGYTAGTLEQRDTQIMVGNLDSGLIIQPSDAFARFVFYKSGGSCTTCRYSYNANLTSVYGTVVNLSTILALPPGETWSGWVSVTIKHTTYDMLYRTIATADSVNSSGDIGWDQNGLDSVYYPKYSQFLGTVSYASYVENSDITIVNPLNARATVNLQLFCYLRSGSQGWATISGYYRDPGRLEQNIILAPYTQINLHVDQLYDTVDSAGNQLCTERMMYSGGSMSFSLNIRVVATGGKVVSLTRDYLPAVTINGSSAYSGRAHRGFRDPDDLSTTYYLPAVYADVCDKTLPDDPYDPSADNLLVTGWHSYNVNFPDVNVSVVLETQDVTSSKVNNTEVFVVSNGTLDTFDPVTGGIVCRNPRNQFEGGFAIFKLQEPIPDPLNTRLVVYSNQVGKGFWRSMPWATNLSSDVYSRNATSSEIPLAESQEYLPYFSSYVYGSAAEEGDQAFGNGSASAEDWTMYNYGFSSDGDVYETMKRAMESTPTSVWQTDLQTTFSTITGDGVYELSVPFDQAALSLSELSSAIVPNSSRIVFIEATKGEVTVSISPMDVPIELYGQSARQNLLLVVKGDVRLLPGANSIGVDGGDYLDLGIIATGTVMITKDDDSTPGTTCWQRDPLLIDGLLFAQSGVLNERDLGASKNTLYPSYSVRWEPGLILNLSVFFDKEGTEFDIPGVW